MTARKIEPHQLVQGDPGQASRRHSENWPGQKRGSGANWKKAESQDYPSFTGRRRMRARTTCTNCSTRDRQEPRRRQDRDGLAGQEHVQEREGQRRSARPSTLSKRAVLTVRFLTKAGRMFATMLRYKLAQRGGQLVEVDPRYTSQACAECADLSTGAIRQGSSDVRLSGTAGTRTTRTSTLHGISIRPGHWPLSLPSEPSGGSARGSKSGRQSMSQPEKAPRL